MRLLTISSMLILSSAIAACSVKSNNPDYEYPPSAALNNAEWPELMDTEQLAALATPQSEADKRAIAGLEARADALRQRSVDAPLSTASTSARADRLRKRALGTRPQGISSARIKRLRERAAALRAEAS